MSTSCKSTHHSEVLRRLWAQLLGEDKDLIKSEDRFFDLGGDSLTASELIDAADEQGIAIKIEDLYKNPSLEELSSCVSTTTSDSGDVAGSWALQDLAPYSTLRMLGAREADIDTVQAEAGLKCCVELHDIEDIYPCTPLQSAMFASTLSGSDHYIGQLAYQFNTRASADGVRQVWQECSKRLPALRTRIVHSSRWGLQQVVVKELCRVQTSPDGLESSLEVHRPGLVGEGDALFGVVIVLDPHTSAPSHLLLTWHHAVLDAAALNLLFEVAGSLQNPEISRASPPALSSFIHNLYSLDLGPSDLFWGGGGQLARAGPRKLTQSPVSEPKGAHCVLSTTFPAEIGRIPGITPALVLRAAWALLLANRTGNPDIVFAATLDGRSELGARRVIAALVTAVPVRARVDFTMSVSDYLDQIRVQAAAILNHQSYGFQNIRKRLPPECQCLDKIETLLLVQSPDSASLAEDLKTLGMTPLRNAGKPFVYDFALVNECQVSGDKVTVDLRYDAAALDEDLVRSLASQYQTILQQFCEHPNARLCDISYLSPHDISTLKLWNSQYIGSDSLTTVVDLLLQQARQTPDYQAVCAWDGSFTYYDLKTHARRVAHYLHLSAIVSGSLVAICSTKSKWVLVSILGILMSGAAWIPIDINHPDERISEVLHIGRVVTAICSSDQESRMRRFVKTCLKPEFITRQVDDIACCESLPSPSPSDLAYVLFTSGSTGHPKGVMVSHRALSNAVTRQGEAMGCNSSWRFLQFSNHTFDPSISESIQVLCYGGTVCVPGETQRLNNLPEAITSLGANCAQLTPSVLSALGLQEVPSLETVILVGEPSSSSLIDKWATRVTLVNAYGPTEACIYCTVARPLRKGGLPSLVGRQCGSTVWVVHPEDHERLVPVGSTGEIVCSGASLANGYLNDEEATESSFVECHWLTEFQPESPSKAIYKTGDLGYQTPDGNFHLLGRKDNQVKLRGNRVEIGEIENRLSAYAPDAVVCVVHVKAGILEGHLVCLICLKGLRHTQSQTDHRTATTRVQVSMNSIDREILTRLREKLAAHVPSYMVPAYWGAVDSMPMNANGKLDRKEMREFLGSADGNLRDLLAPASESIPGSTCGPTEATPSTFASKNPAEIAMGNNMRSLWANILCVDGDELTDASSFFQLGGDSLASIKLVSSCREAGIQISIQDIIDCRTFGRVCQRACRHNQGEGRPHGGVETAESYALTPAQAELVAQHGTAGLKELREWRRIKLDAEVPVKRLETAFEQLMLAHPACRSRLGSKTKRMEVLTPQDAFRFHVGLYCYLSEEQVAKLEQEVYYSVDISDGATLAAAAYRFNGGLWLYVVASSLLIDSRSWEILLTDLDEIIGQRSTPSSSEHVIGDLCREDIEYAADLTSAESVDHTAVLGDQRGVKGVLHHTEKVESAFSNGDFMVGSDDRDLSGHAVLHMLREFVKGADSWPEAPRVRIRYECQRPDGFHGAIGNFDTTSKHLVLPKALDDDLSWTQIRLELGQLAHQTIWDVADDIVPIQHPRPANLVDLDVHVRVLSKEENIRRWKLFNKVTVPSTEKGLNPLVDPGCPNTDAVTIEVNVRSGNIHTACYFDPRASEAEDVRTWVTSLWHDYQPGTLQRPVPDARLGFVSWSRLATSDASTLAGRLDSRVENVYLGSPMQRFMCSASAASSNDFDLRYKFELCSTDHRRLTLDQVEAAWHRVAHRHEVLRTSILPAPASGEVICIVHQDTRGSVEIETDPMGRLWASRRQLREDNAVNAPRLFIDSSRDGVVCCQLFIHHALIDGQSMSALLKDMVTELVSSQGARAHASVMGDFSRFASRIREASNPLHQAFWARNVLHQVSPCILRSPKSDCIKQDVSAHTTGEPRIRSLTVPPIPFVDDQGLPLEHSSAALIDVAWALTLNQYQGSTVPVFGNIISERSAFEHGDIFVSGPCIQLVISTVDLSQPLMNDDGSSPDLPRVLTSTQAQRTLGLMHASGCLSAAEEQGISMIGRSLFNTAINSQKVASTQYAEEGVTVNLVDLVDPWPPASAIRVPGMLSGRIRWLSSAVAQVPPKDCMNDFKTIVSHLTFHTARLAVDIMLRAWEADSHLEARLEYRPPRMDGDFVAGIGRAFARHLQMLVAHCG